ncbi:MAG: protein-L-isoaspartate(D-aspartate) O-methyltransferase [Bryobacteraceae bacterium]|nr:protein-L-isoaspartate(D-aspartate) O-methyltransferase [Bryobacteraceae bacterium]
MIPPDQLEGRGIRDPRVLAAIRSVPRALFVPDDLRACALDDRPLDIGWGATISQPYIVAAMTELLDLCPVHKVLEVGTGSGYQAAVLSQLVHEVCSIEVIPELGLEATERLERLGYINVRVRIGDGYAGWPEDAPFDRIILTAAPPDIPPELIHQLAAPGRLVAPLGEPSHQNLWVFDKDAAGHTESRRIFGVSFVPMVSGHRH